MLEIKKQLAKKSKFRLQKAAYFSNLFASKNYFEFSAYKYGPYSYAIDIVSKSLHEFSQYHQVSSIDEIESMLYRMLASDSVDKKMSEAQLPIQKACSFINRIPDDQALECLATICFILEKDRGGNEEDVIRGFRNWSKEKSEKFTDDMILRGLESLHESRLVSKSLTGYELDFH